MSTMTELLDSMPQTGILRGIGLRPGKRAPMQIVSRAEVTVRDGIVGDRFRAKPGADRQVTLLQAEHLAVVSAILDRPVRHEDLRRNLLVSGINLLALKDHQFVIGQADSENSVILEMTGHCHPCSRIEEILGPGGYQAVRGHGGITAKVIRGGTLSTGDKVHFLPGK